MRHLRLFLTCLLVIGLLVVAAAQDTPTPVVPTFTPTADLPTLTATVSQPSATPTTAALGIGVTRFDANVWADPLIISNLPASSLPAGVEVELLAIHPTGQWYKISAQDTIYWIEVYGLDIISEQVLLNVERDISPTPAPTLFATSTWTAQPSQTALSTPVPMLAEYGGEVLALNSEVEYLAEDATTGREHTFDALRQAGMTWLKVNIAYTPRIDTQEAGNAISEAQQAGFKVLVALTGDGAQMTYGGDEYFDAYIKFVREVADLNPDAIEVWSAPNRNWSPNDISGTAYVQRMLRPAYNAIKTTNPSIMVISGGLQPINASEVSEEQAQADVFLSEMMAAGATNSMDCLGAQYDGVVAPYATSGDLRDNRFIRYLMPMIDQYRMAVHQRIPVCITALGYLQTENNLPLQRAYPWAISTTLEKQTNWHLEAWAMARNQGAVRLVIVHSMDAALFNTDIPAGYSMIQADGSCPFCEKRADELYLEQLPKGTIQRTTNIRAGAGIEFNPPVGSFEMGTQIVILGVHPAGDWYHVRETGSQMGREGWVRGEDIGEVFSAPLSNAPTEVGPPPPAATITPQLRPSATPTARPTATPTPGS